MMNKKIAFIGGGNMATAMVGGLLSTGYSPDLISISETWDQAITRLKSQFPLVKITNKSTEIVGDAQVIVLAVKPQVIRDVALELSPLLNKDPLIITIAAGIRVEDLSQWIQSQTIVRVMPNTPALLNQGASGLYASPSVSKEQKETAWNILESISKKQYWIEKEDSLDVVTAISGSGPAYFFLLVECLTDAGVEAGLDYEIAKGLASQTCLGAGAMLTNTSDSPSELRTKVTSPNGTTHAAITSLENVGLRSIVKDAVQAAIDRGVEMGREMSFKK